jgi:hypothetical protein
MEYVVDAREPGGKTMTIHAQIQGLEPGEMTLELLSSKESSLGIGNRIGSLGVRMADGRIKRIVAKRNKFRFEHDSAAPLEISYRLKSASIVDLGRSSLLDENRYVLSSSDTFLVPETARALIKVSFLLPDKWKVVTLATPSSPESYEVEGRKETFFYLGEAIGISERINNCAVTLAVEGDWPMSSRDALRETRNQIIYLQNVAADWKPRALFVAFLSPRIALPKAEATSFRRDTIFLIPSQASSGKMDDLGSLHLQLAEKLVTCFLPITRRSPDIQGGLITYLAMKTCLKTGGISKAEFFDKMSRGLREDPAVESDMATLERRRKSRRPVSGSRQALDFFAVDLALAFEGKQSGAMIGALQKSSQELRRTEGDWLKRLAGEASLAQLAAGLSRDPGNNELADLLRPFGLVLERIETPHLNFELSETFQVSRLERQIKGPLS